MHVHQVHSSHLPASELWTVRRDIKPRSRVRAPVGVPDICKVIGGDTECLLQVCQLIRSSESTHFLFLRRDVALFDSTRAPDGF